MIEISKISNEIPFNIFKKFYLQALEKNQESIEAISISSLNKKKNEIESRYVNLKYVIDKKFIFFSNYKSLKADDFSSHNQISALFYWNKIDTQIRIKASIEKSSKEFSDEHYQMRSNKKNALAHSSEQSTKVKSYEEVQKNYNNLIISKETLKTRPEFWGGYSFEPYYIEFWQGNTSRINKRTVYELVDDKWSKYFLNP